MPSVVEYTGDHERTFGGIMAAPGDEITFDQGLASRHGWDDPDEFALYFVHVFSNQGATPWFRLRKVAADGSRTDVTLPWQATDTTDTPPARRRRSTSDTGGK